MSCYLAKYGYMEDGSALTPCDGQLVRAHLIPRQLLKRQFPRGHTFRNGQHLSVDQLIDHPATWVACCGGLTGIGGHHGHFDFSKRLRLHRRQLPAMTEAFARELQIEWHLDHAYGLLIRG
jgi:hypothetical protein